MSLSQLVQSLPQELCDQILDLVLTPDSPAAPPGEAHIDQDYKWPPQLHINQACRRKFASRYFSTTTFYVKEPEDIMTNRYVPLANWLKSLPQEHRDLLPDSVVRVESYPRRCLKFAEEMHEAMLTILTLRNWMFEESVDDDLVERLCTVPAWKRVGSGEDDYEKIWSGVVDPSCKAKLATALQDGYALWL